jgi:hypothetical protein
MAEILLPQTNQKIEKYENFGERKRYLEQN